MDRSNAQSPFDPGKTDPKLMEAVGRAIIMWSYTEAAVSQIFVTLTGGESAAMYVVTENVSQKNIANWIRTLIETKSYEPLDEEVLQLLDEVDVLRNERNTFAHGLWGFDAGEGAATIMSVKLERSAIITDTVVTLADIEEFISETVTVGNRLIEILKRVQPVV